MAIINSKYKFVFLFEPHTASRATRNALKKLEGSKVVGEHHITVKKMNQRNMMNLREKAYKTISTIRNPYDYFVTYYMMNDGGRSPFVVWLEKFFKHHDRIFRHPYSDYLIRYEAIPDSLNDVLRRFNAPPIELEYIGKTRDKPPWKEMYCEKAVEIMEQNLPDSLRFGYSLDGRFEGDQLYGRHAL